jgi:hypothetical protein
VHQVLAHPDGIGHGGESRAYRAYAREEAGVRYIEVVQFVGLAVDVKH